MGPDVNKQTTNDLPPVGALHPSENRWRREIQPFPSSPREKGRIRRTFFMEGVFPRIYFGWWYIIIAFFWSYLLCVPSHASPFFFSLYLSRCAWFLPACILNAFDSFLYLSLHLSRVMCVNNTCQKKKKRKLPFIWRKLIINHVLTPNRNNNN